MDGDARFLKKTVALKGVRAVGEKWSERNLRINLNCHRPHTVGSYTATHYSY